MSGEGEWDPYSGHFAAAESATKSHLTERPLHTAPTQLSYKTTGEIMDGRYVGAATNWDTAFANYSIFDTGGVDPLIGSLSFLPPTC
jgi:hypothetical protein